MKSEVIIMLELIYIKTERNKVFVIS